MFMPTLDCKRVMFYSQADEAAFFRFAESIKAVRRIEGVRDSIVLHIASRISQESLRDLIALFERYRIPRMSQLAQFLSPSNRSWFADPKGFWHKKVFTDATRHI
jgi:hypothetical protein